MDAYEYAKADEWILQKMESATDDESVDLRCEIEDDLSDLQAMKAEIAPMLEAIATIEARIRTNVLRAGFDVDTDYASATIRAGYERSTWNSKALDGYAAAHPEILEFKKTTNVRPTVAIKIKEN